MHAKCKQVDPKEAQHTWHLIQYDLSIWLQMVRKVDGSVHLCATGARWCFHLSKQSPLQYVRVRLMFNKFSILVRFSTMLFTTFSRPPKSSKLIRHVICTSHQSHKSKAPVILRTGRCFCDGDHMYCTRGRNRKDLTWEIWLYRCQLSLFQFNVILTLWTYASS